MHRVNGAWRAPAAGVLSLAKRGGKAGTDSRLLACCCCHAGVCMLCSLSD